MWNKDQDRPNPSRIRAIWTRCQGLMKAFTESLPVFTELGACPELTIAARGALEHGTDKVKLMQLRLAESGCGCFAVLARFMTWFGELSAKSPAAGVVEEAKSWAGGAGRPLV